MLFIRPTERNLAIARAAQIYYHKGAYSDEKLVEQQKPVEQKADQKKAEQKKPVVEQKTEQKKPDKPVVEQKAEQKKPVVEQKTEQKKPDKPVEQKTEQKKPVVEQKTEQKKPVEQAEQKKPVDQKKPAEAVEKKPAEQAEQKKPVDQKKPVEPVVEPVVEVLDSEGNIVAMLPGVPEEAPKAAKTASGFDINNFVKPKQSKPSTKEFRDTKNIDEVYGFMRSAGVPGPFDPMPGFSLNEKVTVLKKYANFNGTHPGLDVIQLNTLIMVFNSPDLSRRMVDCGLDPKQVLGVKKFNEVPVSKYDNSDTYDFAFEYSIAKKKKLVLLLNSIPTYDSKNGWMSAYNISLH